MSSPDSKNRLHVAGNDPDAEWQRVNSYIADVLKDCYVLFAKLARLRGDFAGQELSSLDDISAKVRDLGQELSGFSKAFTDGEYAMNRKEQFGGSQNPSDVDVPKDFEPTAEDFDFSPQAEQGQSDEPEVEDFEGKKEPEKKSEKKQEKKSEKKD